MLAARHLAYRVAHALLVAWWFVRRPHTRGVKLVLVRDDGALLFVRHTYGDRESWEVPGGHVRRREAPQDAAAREGLEELGLTPDWRGAGIVETGRRGRTTTIHVFTARAGADPDVRMDPGELAEVRWAPRDDAPLPLGRETPAVLSVARRARATRTP